MEEEVKNAVLTTSTMANFNNMMFSNSIKGLISKKRNRYKQDGFDLDLTYIRHNIIAMGYPASNIEGKVIRNHIDDVVKLLDSKHKDHYKIYNLCSERSYDATKFHNRVKMFPFDDHNPPKIDLIRPFCVDVHEWLTANSENVAAVHCKAGKGRTGTMICCYLLHSQIYETADDALSFYGNTRTQDKKGVTIPSQVRYIRYYESMIREHLVYSSVSLYVTELKLEPPPTLTSAQGGSLYFTISSANFKKKCKSIVQEVRKGDVKCLTLKVDACVPITGDIKIELYSKSPLKKKQFQFWFNTFFVRDEWSGQTTACCTSPVVAAAAASSDLNGYSGQNGGGGAATTANVGILHSQVPLSASNNCSSSSSSSNTGETLVLTLTKSELDNLNKKDKQNKTFSADFKIMLLLRRPSKNIWMPAQQEGMGQHVIQDSPSGSSEGDSSDGDDDDEAWDSGECSHLVVDKPYDD